MMCSMVKKGLLGAGVGALTLGLLFGTSAPSYVKAFFTHVRKNVQTHVPVDVQIERARQEIAALEPAIHTGIEALAKAEVEVEDLTRQIADHRQNLDKQQRELVALREAMDVGYRRTDSTDKAKQIEAAAARRLDSFRHSKQLLGQKEETLKLKQQQVDAARETLEKMMEQKKLLAAKVEQIETRLKQIQATQASNEFTFDATALSKAKQSVADLEKRLSEMAKIAEYEGRLVDSELPIVIEPSRDVAREIDEELHGTATNSTDKPL
jgi:chromosome segregation ATPase